MCHLIMEIKDFKSINNAKIEINKINVISGVNGCGKSSISKIFYSFLKANSIQRKDFVLSTIVNHINDIIDKLNRYDNEYDLQNHLTINDDYLDIKNNYYHILNICKKHEKIAKLKTKKLEDEFVKKCRDLISLLNNDGIDIGYLQDYLNSPEDEDYVDTLYELLNQNEHMEYVDYIHDLNSICDSFNYFKYTKNIYSSCLDIGPMVNAFFGEDNPSLSEISFKEILLNERIFNVKNSISFYIEPNYYNAFNYFFNQKNFINSVYYVDNVSIFDLFNLKSSNSLNLYSRVRYLQPDILYHMDEIIKNLFGNYQTNEPAEEFIEILTKIDKIIRGRYDKNHPTFVTDKPDEKNKFFFSDKIETDNFDTPSGIKQIGIIQLLLLNNKLKKDGYLIIDEPEVNLHPDWQFKFAEILVLLAKDLNITIYLNSHSPFFIEAIDAFTEYYDMQEDINYYLAEETEAEGEYDFNKIHSYELYRIYDNLGNPYDLIDELRLKKHLGE